MTIRTGSMPANLIRRLVLIAVLGASTTAWTGTRHWNGSAGTDWFVDANWTPSGVPTNGTSVVIASATAPGVIVSNTTAQLASLTVSNATLTAANWTTAIRAADVVIGNQATVTCAGPFVNPPAVSNRVYIVCSNLTVEAGGAVSVDNRGYAGGAANVSGYGPGASTSSSTSPGAGAGHGGRGGITSGQREGGIRYGTVDEPRTPGSGAGGSNNVRGGAGGGVVRIDAAGHVLVNGTLSANGEKGLSYAGRESGGGAGGAIWITCRTFAGTNGLVRANGGEGLNNNSGGGAGGYVAVHHDPAAQASMPLPAVRFTASPGRGAAYHPVADAPAVPTTDNRMFVDRTLEADWGSLFFTDAVGVVRITGSVDHVAGYLTFGNATSSFPLASLTLDNAYLGFAGNAALNIANGLSTTTSGGLIGRDTLTLSVGGDTLLRGDTRIDGAVNFTCGGGVTIRDSGAVSMGVGSVLDVAGGLVITGSTVHLRLKGTDAVVTGDVFVAEGAWLACAGASTNGSVGEAAMRLTATGDIRLDSTSRIFAFADPDKGGIPFLSCQNLIVPAGAGILGDERGYGGTKGPGSVSSSSTAPNGGGGHGGSGGVASTGKAGGIAYGSATEPSTAGGGGGPTQQDANGETGGAGIRISAGEQILVNGIVSVNGKAGRVLSSDRNTGGGAGGSIWLSCETFVGTGGVVRADGGAGAGNSGGGGGGRIAVHYSPAAQASMPAPTVRFTVSPGRGFRPLSQASTAFLSDRTAYLHREHEADWGSLYFSDTSGVTQIGETIGNVSGHLTFGNGVTNLSLGSLTLDNAWFGFDNGAIITLAGGLDIGANAGLLGRKPLALHIGGAADIAGEMRFDDAVAFSCGGALRVESQGTVSFVEGATLGIGGGLTVTGENVNVMLRGVDAAVTGTVHLVDGGWLSAMGYATDGSIDDASMRLAVEGDILVETNSSLFVYADADQGGSPRFRCRDLLVRAGGAFRADGRGYVENMGPGKGALGGAPDGAPTGAGGAGHGGPGGKSANNVAGGIAYGSARLPAAPGSGGGYCSNSSRGGSGGSLIRIRVDGTAIINGALNADGADGGVRTTSRAPGGGSGGGIHLVVGGAVRGGPTGLLTADGGSSGDPTHVAGGGGGGGRIAVWQFVPDAFYDQILADDFSLAISNSVPVQFAGSWSVTGGLGYEDGGDGTVVFYRAQPAGTLFMIR